MNLNILDLTFALRIESTNFGSISIFIVALLTTLRVPFAKFKIVETLPTSRVNLALSRRSYVSKLPDSREEFGKQATGVFLSMGSGRLCGASVVFNVRSQLENNSHVAKPKS